MLIAGVMVRMNRGLEDQPYIEVPHLPRFLFIGDSISQTYEQSLRASLAGKANVRRPPINCESSLLGRDRIADWLGPYTTPGKQWDVISFNFGHWDSDANRQTYQRNLEFIISKLEPTGAQLVWVTTCPVSNVRAASKSHTSGQKAGINAKFLNPWAAEIMANHPSISVCDMWQFVKNNETTIYAHWWNGTDIHFQPNEAKHLGNFLGDYIAAIIKREADSPQPSTVVLN